MAKAQGIRLEEGTQERLKWLAEKRDRSMSYLIKEAVDRYLRDEERFELEKQEDQERLQHFIDTGEHISHGRMKAKFDRLIAKAKRASK